MPKKNVATATLNGSKKPVARNTQIIDFDTKTFPSLIFMEYEGTWNLVGLSELAPEEQNICNLFLNAIEAENSDSFDPESCLLIKAEAGTLKSVYGPCIFSQDDELIMKMGANVFPVKQNKKSFTIGMLEGSADVKAEKDSSLTEYPKASITFLSPDGDMFNIPIGLNGELELTVAEVKAAIMKGENLAPLLRSAPGNGGSTLKMQDLDLGEYQVLSITENEEGEFGVNYTLHLSDGRAVYSRGNVTTACKYLMERGWQPPLSLTITRIEEIGDGKFSIDCALRKRLPRLPRASNKKEQTATTIDVPATPTDTETDKETDDIPF